MGIRSFRNIVKVLFLIVVFAWSAIAFAQTEKIAFEKYGVEEGLPEEFVISMVQDEQGFIWFTTQNGLVKFDGYRMEVFKADRSDPDSLLGISYVDELLLSRNGKIWIGSSIKSGGLACFDPTTEKFKNFLPALNDSLKIPYSSNDLLFEDIEENIWFNSYSSETNESVLCRINSKTLRVSRYPFKMRRKFNDIVLNFQIAESKKDSSVWLRTEDKTITRYNRELDVFETQFNKGDIIPGSTIRDSIVDLIPAGNSGLIPMANNENLFLWDPLKRKVVETYNFPKHDSISWGASFEDKQGNFWNSSHDNLTFINRALNEQRDYKFGSGELSFEFAPKTITSIQPLLNEDQFVWFIVNSDSNRNRSVLRYGYEQNNFEWFNSQFNEDGNNINLIQNAKLLRDRSGVLWLGTRPNLYKQNSKVKQITLFKHNSKDLTTIPSDTINILFEDSKKRLWVGTEAGLSIRGTDELFKKVNFEGDENEDHSGSINFIYEDSRNQIWVVRDNKLFRKKENQQNFEPIKFVDGRNLMFGLADDGNGNIWVSLWNQGVYIIDGNSTKILQRFEPENQEIHGLLSNRIFSFFLDSRGFMWLGDPYDNEFGIFKYSDEEKNFKHYSFDDTDSLSLGDNEISFLAEDDQDRMWIGTDGGINLYDHEKDVFYRNKDDLNLPSVHAYYKGTDGKMWFWAYSGGGLALVGPEVNTVEIFNEADGLLHNDGTIRGEISLDVYGQLWLPTYRGLSVFDAKNQKFKNYFKKDGFQNYDGFYVSQKTENGDIWIGGLNGLNQIEPDNLLEKDTIPPAVLITSIAVLDSLYSSPDGEVFTKAVSYTKQIHLKHWQKDLSFEFVALHYLRSEDNQYSWKLENYDQHWSMPSKDRKVAYTNLSPGTYTFRVRGSNADGVWNEEGAFIKISIAHPWWLTIWAYFIYAMVLILVGFRVHVFQKERTLRLAKEKSQLKELEQAKEIKKAYSDLKATQNQLIQSEKMASLGELTAGIAHEIQNPLNFVNNFSELNTELIDELDEEIGKGNMEEVKALAKDIKENELKINHHGKRADSIVKGMLQHSRKSTGKKEPTDINTLADEYLRLAYHGLRAKDKSFNATMSTDFDKSIGKISVVSQDLGRAVLNLITNAFHAVQDKKIELGKEFEPTVSVLTQKNDKDLFILIKDNGNGIPKKILNKIFHPFFTTKSSGQGTGLGLSLSYDIVKAHGGELKVTSEEGIGTTFSIMIPIN